MPPLTLFPVFAIATVSIQHSWPQYSLVHIPYCFCQHFFSVTNHSRHSPPPTPSRLQHFLHFCTRQLPLIALYCRPKIFEFIHLYQVCSLQHHLPTALSLSTHMYLFICLFVCLFVFLHIILHIYILLYELCLIPNDVLSSPQSIPPPIQGFLYLHPALPPYNNNNNSNNTQCHPQLRTWSMGTLA